MNEAKFLKDFIDYIYYTENKSNWFLAIPDYLEKFHNKYEHIIFKEKSGLVYGGVEWKFDPNIPDDCLLVDGKIYKLWEGDKIDNG
jgi:hypothetical protein